MNFHKSSVPFFCPCRHLAKVRRDSRCAEKEDSRSRRPSLPGFPCLAFARTGTDPILKKRMSHGPNTLAILTPCPDVAQDEDGKVAHIPQQSARTATNPQTKWPAQEQCRLLWHLGFGLEDARGWRGLCIGTYGMDGSSIGLVHVGGGMRCGALA